MGISKICCLRNLVLPFRVSTHKQWLQRVVGTIVQAFLRCWGDPGEMGFSYVADRFLGNAALIHEREKHWDPFWDGAVQGPLYTSGPTVLLSVVPELPLLQRTLAVWPQQL